MNLVEAVKPAFNECVIIFTDNYYFAYLNKDDNQWYDWDTREWIPEGEVKCWIKLPNLPDGV